MILFNLVHVHMHDLAKHSWQHAFYENDLTHLELSESAFEVWRIRMLIALNYCIQSIQFLIVDVVKGGIYSTIQMHFNVFGCFFAPGYIDIWYYAHAEKMGILWLNICTFFWKCQVNQSSFYVRDRVYFSPQMSTFWKMQRCRQYTCNIFLNCHMYTNIVIGTFLVCTSALENVDNFDMTHIMKMHSSVVKKM